MKDSFDIDELLRAMERPPQLSHLYKVHPHFDKYPRYMKDGLMANERLQGRVK